MKIAEIYKLFVDLGWEYDPRDKTELAKLMEKNKKQYAESKENEREFYDIERLANPYYDTRILYGDPNIEVKKVLAGIDIENAEILLADRLREKGEKIDLVIAHHPEGRALINLYQIMHMQEDMLADLGVPINVAEGILSSRISEVQRSLMPLNHNRAVDSARILDIPFMCVHTPADNMVNTFLTRLFEEKIPETLNDVVKTLKDVPEYNQAAKMDAGPRIVVGKGDRRAGKIFIDMTGGTGGSEEAFEKLAIAGVGTVIGMHIGEKHRKEAEKNHINIVIAGHMASDSLGINLLLDKLQQEGIEILPCSGLIRIKRA